MTSDISRTLMFFHLDRYAALLINTVVPIFLSLNISANAFYYSQPSGFCY